MGKFNPTISLINGVLLGLLIVVVSASAINWGMQEPQRNILTDRQAINMTAWKFVDDSTFTDADTTGFLCDSLGTGQVWITNTELSNGGDTLLLSIDRGINFMTFPPGYASAAFRPMNIDSLWFWVKGATAGDSSVTPEIQWSYYAGQR